MNGLRLIQKLWMISSNSRHCRHVLNASKELLNEIEPIAKN